MKVNFDEKILILIFIIISILLISISSYLSETYKIQCMSQGYYSSNTIYFRNESNNNLNIEQIKSIINNSIFFKELDLNYDIRGIIYSGKILMPEIKEGRFFEEADFNSGKKLAVIGSEFNNNIQKIENEEYVIFNNDKYKIIGIMGYKQKSTLDRACFLTLDNSLLNTPGTFAIDGENNNNVISAYNKISKYLDSNIQIDREINSLNKFFNLEKYNISMFCTLIISFLLTTISISLYWIKRRNREIAVLRLVGYNDIRISLSIFTRYFKLVHIALLFGFIIGIIGILILGYNLSVSILVVSYLLVLLCCILVVTIPILKALKINVDSQLRCKI